MLLFHLPFARYYDRQSTSHALYLRRFAFARTQPDKLVYLHPDCQPTRTAMRPFFISHALRETYTQFRRKSPYTPAFAADTAAPHPVLPLSTPLFPQAVQGSAFHSVLVSCGTYSLSFAKTSTFIEVFARLCIFIHCVIACFSPMRLLFPSLRSFSHCRSVSDDRASTPLSYTRFRIPPSRTRAVSSIRVCILYPRSSLSSRFSTSFHLTLAIGVTFALFACTFL